MPQMTVVIPCFNEAERLPRDQVLALAAAEGVNVLCVDDGSRDRTLEVLRDLEAQSAGRVQVLALPRNGGKGEAVRQGLLEGLRGGAAWVGFLDADFATPGEELLRLRGEMDARGAAVGMGARIARAGAQIDRKASRHYTGRVFATLASMVLGLAIYDTQCGAKLFAANAALREALAEPFHSRWSFDVELLGRLLSGAAALPPEQVYEMPLERWTDVGGSKLSLGAMLRSTAELASIGLALRRRR
jgi:glycosyltransferase involved in cell wall biosynthesis